MDQPAAAVRPRWPDVAILMAGMGVAVTVSWFAFGRRDSYALDLDSMLGPARLLVYAMQFLLVAGFVVWMVRTRMRSATRTSLAIAVLAAWIGEGIVLTVIGEPFVANELDPPIAWYYWLVAAAGPIQPAVAFLAGWLALRGRPVS